MKNLIFFIFCFLPFTLCADIGSFDVFTIEMNGEEYYFPFASVGILKDNDLCYYDYSGAYEQEVVDFLVDKFSQGFQIYLYRKLDVVDISPIAEILSSSEPLLYKLTDRIEVDGDSLVGAFEVTSAVHGNTVGMIFSEDLSENDNFWLQQVEIELLFSVGSVDLGGECGMDFFGIKNSMSLKEIEELKVEMNVIVTGDNYWETFSEKLHELYTRQIIMFGTCSC